MGKKKMLMGGKIAEKPFITEWTVTDGQTIVLPTTSGSIYDYIVDWGDGSAPENITSYVNSHTYINEGIYDISIIGILPVFNFFLLTTNKLFISGIKQWGDVSFSILSFHGCANLSLTVIDKPNFNTDASVTSIFRDIPSFNSDNVSNWDMENITNGYGMFWSDGLFNQPLNWVAFPEDVQLMLNRAYAFDQNLGNIDVSRIELAANFLNAVNMSTVNYDLTLIGWGSQTVKSGVTISMGTSKYTLGGAAEAGRDSLIAQGWAITDGGGI